MEDGILDQYLERHVVIMTSYSDGKVFSCSLDKISDFGVLVSDVQHGEKYADVFIPYSSILYITLKTYD